MKNDKEISIDQFTADEKILVEQRVKMLTDKLSHIASKKEEKEILKEAKRLVMKERVTRESSKQVLAKRPRRPSAAKESEIKDFDWAASLRKNPRALK
ncbi:hypothetical protein [Erwinia amylovora]|uniref:Uncharacterized protein n=4 Tax=Erwinia amylovora TaxID=552 RepID=A0A831EQZ8_ERWAM|nr:hypothetical protein [Erwinia amylovora]CBX80903.1 hypothetical protein predicted by Glimmer/Critica [Erwinia amylovora ATCC BAA-2158]CCP03454.1 hypothetical protein BN439_2400 [Erwinia amylovora Ea644]CDK15491.1 hypothetical protein LA635_1867 [Erwinia amylovora LA635]CDK18858.1 hypothetical protein LA636_1866 [Erwinia amylovora LA636]CDK22228.1 hypothetical protein LA637_1868 [Erwinia amylovora LA637]